MTFEWKTTVIAIRAVSRKISARSINKGKVNMEYCARQSYKIKHKQLLLTEKYFNSPKLHAD